MHRFKDDTWQTQLQHLRYNTWLCELLCTKCELRWPELCSPSKDKRKIAGLHQRESWSWMLCLLLPPDSGSYWMCEFRICFVILIAGQELCHGQTTSAVDAPECGRNAPSKINYPHGQFSVACFELAIVPLKESCVLPHSKLHATQQINTLNVSQCLNHHAGHQQWRKISPIPQIYV